ncbi:glycosyltransferase [Leptolyngbya sp. NK1-12]
MALPYLEQFGWEAHVLAVQPDCIEAGIEDPFLSKTIPSHIPITYTKALPVQQTRKLGLGSLGLRSFPYLLQAGDRLLQQQKFDLVFFSNTVFTSMALGPRWRKRFGVPYILDFQDPWLNDYYKQSGVTPPGGRFKYGFSQLQAKLLEPKVVIQASHIISVSPAYPQILQRRYPSLNSSQLTVLPFGAPKTDFDLLPSLQIQQRIFDINDRKRHWVYVGRGGEDMALALRSLFSAIQADRCQNPETWQTVQLHFVGTSYAPKELATKTVEPIAQEFGIADLVTEHPQRIPYFEALQVLAESDAILLIGSSDAGYTASKLYPCILAQKPILAIFHQQSSVVDILRHCHAGQAITFASNSKPQDLTASIIRELRNLLTYSKGWQPPTNWTAFEPYTAFRMTAKLRQIFDQSVAQPVLYSYHA